MCGRYDLSEAHRTLKLGGVEMALKLARTRYNIAPGQWAPLCRREELESSWSEGSWGLLPAWRRETKGGVRPINARSETVAVQPMFRTAFRERRCLVPADGYYEWQTTPSGKDPWRWVRCDGQPMWLAGIWELWRPPSVGEKGGAESESGSEEEWLTFALLTTAANADTRHVHDRMPVILGDQQASDWLDPGTGKSRLLELCRSPDAGLLRGYRVGRIVNSSRNDVPDCIRRVSEEPGSDLFG
jgi:putative SOS response-associated peptidase YedK